MSRYGFGLGHVPFREAISAWMAEAIRASRRSAHRDRSAHRIEGRHFAPRARVSRAGRHRDHSRAGLQRVSGRSVARERRAVSLRAASAHQFSRRSRRDSGRHAARARGILYLNYPNNPTAAIAPRDYLERVVARCRELDILLVYDNAYSELAFDGYVPPSIFEIDGARDVAIEFHSLSKTYNMTGWRCGWAVASPEISSVLTKVKSFTDTGQFMAVQAAGVAALESYDEFVPGNVATFKARRDAAVDAFRAAGFSCDVPRATMYLWIPLPDGVPSALFADRLLDDEGVVVMPGSGFGAGGEGFFRISFITSPERIAEAARRAGRVLASMGVEVG